MRSEIKTFYRLHFLRNTLTHRTINIHGNRVDLQELEIFKDNMNISEGESEVAILISVPREPWKKDDYGTYDEVPLLDVLYRACKVVEDRRDKLLHTIDEYKFNDRYALELRKEELTITLNNKRHNLQHSHLHLECYGLEAELQHELEELRQYETYK